MDYAHMNNNQHTSQIFIKMEPLSVMTNSTFVGYNAAHYILILIFCYDEERIIQWPSCWGTCTCTCDLYFINNHFLNYLPALQCVCTHWGSHRQWIAGGILLDDKWWHNLWIKQTFTFEISSKSAYWQECWTWYSMYISVSLFLQYT